MSERATAFNLSSTGTPPAGNELAVRPKVLRRPAHFGAKPIESPVPVLLPLQSSEFNEQPLASTPARAWQDDGKFAITLLGLVILVNIIVSAWLSAISPAKPTHATDAAPTAENPVHVLDTPTRDISEQ